MQKFWCLILLLGVGVCHAQNTLIMAMTPPQGPHAPDWANFNSKIVPHIDGVALFCPWNQIETSPGIFNFSICDNLFDHFPATLKHVLILELMGNTSSNAIPSFYLKNFQTVSCPGNSNFAVPWGVNWVSKTNAVISQFIAHYNKVGGLYYARISFTQFGQSSIPPCVRAALTTLAGGSAQYQNDLVGAYKNQGAWIQGEKPNFKVQREVSCSQNDCKDFADTMAASNISLGIGIGSGGAQLSDLENFPKGLPCSSDWCALFNQYQRAGVILMLQSYTQTNPANNPPTGSLAVLLPFMVVNHCNSYESYYGDLQTAFEKGNTKYAAAFHAANGK